MRVKICGITNLTDALLCCRLGADALGFIFYEKSKRSISYSQAEEIIKQLPSFILKVGVFLDKDAGEINALVSKIGLNSVQLYEEATQEFINKINAPVIKSFRVKNDFDFSLIRNYKNCSIMLDTFSESAPGGTGESFDWSKIPKNLGDKIILAGGISSKNIKYIYENIKPQAVDLSSSVEHLPGKKDEDKLIDFFKTLNELRYQCL